jgi:tetratricopeptide (TPR) repeat protein
MAQTQKMVSPESDNTDEQIRRYESFIEVDPKNPLLWITLGDLYHEAARADEGYACFEKALLNDPENRVAKARIGNVMITQHRFAEAEQLFRTLAEADAPPPAVLHNLGMTLLFQGRPAEALDVFRRADASGIEDLQNLAYITYALHQSGDTEKAIESAKKWLELEHTDAVEGYLALLEMDHGDMELAHERATAILQRDPENVDAVAVEGIWSIEQDEIDEARTHFALITRNEPNNPRGWLGLGLACMYAQQHDDAIKHLERALSFMPDNVGTIVTLGWAHVANQNAAEAEKVFRHAIDTDRNFGEAHGGLATALVYLNRIDEAQAEIKRAIGLDPHGFGAFLARAGILQIQGQGTRGAALLSKVLEQAPGGRGKPLIEYLNTYVRSETAKKLPSQGSRQRPLRT